MSQTSSKVRQSVSKREREDSLPVSGKKQVAIAAGNIFDFFPGTECRDGQREAIEQIHEAFTTKGRRFVVAELPTGVGKSYVAVTFARYFKSAHILTIQKILQRQYSSEPAFADYKIASMKGRGAYACINRLSNLVDEVGKEFGYDHIDETNIPEEVDKEVRNRVRNGAQIYCDKGPCRKNSRISCDLCEYRIAIDVANKAAITVHNFDGFYYQTTVAHLFGSRPLLVIDEAHQIESKYLNFMEFTLSNKKYPGMKFSVDWDIKDCISFVRTFFNDAGTQLYALQKKKDDSELDEPEVRNYEELSSLVTKIGIFLAKYEEGSEYVVTYKDMKDYQTLTFRPVDVGSYAYNHLFSYGTKVLMLSATIVDKEYFCKNIGLNPNEVEFVQIGSSFPAKNRPIVKHYVGQMNYNNIGETLPKLLAGIEAILDKMGNRKGIIQTHTDRVANYIRDNLHDPRLTFRTDFRTVEDMLEVHKKKEGSVIVASGLREGLDLKDDLSRFQILCKVPYPDLGDKRTAKKKALDPKWYNITTVLSFVQTLGRSVRSKNDKAITYLMDTGFDNFLSWNRRYIPKYIRESIHEES